MHPRFWHWNRNIRTYTVQHIFLFPDRLEPDRRENRGHVLPGRGQRQTLFQVRKEKIYNILFMTHHNDNRPVNIKLGCGRRRKNKSRFQHNFLSREFARKFAVFRPVKSSTPSYAVNSRESKVKACHIDKHSRCI